MSSIAWLDTKYLLLLAHRFRNFKKKGTTSWNFSCPYCGDSKRSPRKARGYVYSGKSGFVYHCHKCGVHVAVWQLIKDTDQHLFNEYMKEKLLNNSTYKPSHPIEELNNKMKPPNFVKYSSFGNIPKVSQLPTESYAKRYVMSRHIPAQYHHKLFLCEKFKAWTNTFIPNKFENITKDEARLIIPFLDDKDRVFGFQGRSFDPDSELRYITIMLDENMPKIYGMDRIDVSKDTIYAVEGPIDSLFIPNCVASAGGSIASNLTALCDDKSKFVVIYDNEPRNKHTIKKMISALDSGFKICIWPDNMNGSDPNDMILRGYTSKELRYIIDKNTFTGLPAKLRLQQWKKI